MRVLEETDLGGVVPILRAKLEASTVEAAPTEYLARGTVRGYRVRVRCWDRPMSTGWVVVVDRHDAPPLSFLLSAWRSRRGPRGVRTGDALFDVAWSVDAAPAAAAREVLDAAVREAMSRLGRGSRPPLLHGLFGLRVAPALQVGSEEVRVGARGMFEGADVGVGVDLAVLVAEGIERWARARHEAGPREAALADDDEVARLVAARRPSWQRSPGRTIVMVAVAGAAVSAGLLLHAFAGRASSEHAAPPVTWLPEAGSGD